MTITDGSWHDQIQEIVDASKKARVESSVSQATTRVSGERGSAAKKNENPESPTAKAGRNRRAKEPTTPEAPKDAKKAKAPKLTATIQKKKPK